MKASRQKRRKNRIEFTPCLLAGLLILSAALPDSARAQNIFNTGSGNWTTPNLWSFGVPIAGQEVRIGGTNARTATITTNSAISGDSYLGYGSGETGTVSITGIGSLWQNRSKLTVGGDGNGVLNIKAGSKVISSSGVIGKSYESSGKVTVTGKDSLWENSDEITLGEGGTGILNIEAGGKVTSSRGILGNAGAVTVTGKNSLWENSGELEVGEYDTGTLNISAGGKVTSITGQIQGTVTVAGKNSLWENQSYVSLRGTLNIENAGVVTASEVSMGRGVFGQSGILTLKGAPDSQAVLSTGEISGIGKVVFDGGIFRASENQSAIFASNDEGEGMILAAGGGTVDSNGRIVSINTNINGSGSLTKMGTGSLMLRGTNTYTGYTVVKKGDLGIMEGSSNATSNIIVGQSAGDNGILIVSAGGSMTDSSGILGNDVGSQGTAYVLGTWTNRKSIRVGNRGTGSLTVNSGGTISALTVELGTYATGTGALIVNGTLLTGEISEIAGNGKILIDGGTLKATASSSNFLKNFESGDIVLGAGGGTINSNGFNIVANSALSGTGRLVKDGKGSLTLTAGNTYSGKTTILAGTLQIGNGGTAGSITGFVSNKGTLSFKHSDQVVFSGNMGGTGKLVQNGTGTLIVSGRNAYSGGTVVNSGTLLVANATALGTGNLDLNSGSLGTDGIEHQINVGGDFVWKVGATIALTLTADSNSERVVVAGGIRKAGAGKAIFEFTPIDLPPGHTNFLVLTVAEGFGSLTAGSFGYTSSDPGFDGVFRISGKQLWFDDDYVPSLSASSFASSTSVTTVPEPSTWMLMGLGLGWIVWFGKTHRRVYGMLE